ncbi:hypothetical protein P872_21780 [Rhodonellum psychrophilum GCM71 = DSM 17998]|uniref:Uncharacterized protein n=1 Tax=Rhodonellum psychrophilum GCM71 = DSM 17998 TaxID=1123057 RepID=U5BRC7_9BACT|nr:hypothetical protein P872_21780 [Rhodonellum psychrophilum GCM71 = DSM 17998]
MKIRHLFAISDFILLGYKTNSTIKLTFNPIKKQNFYFWLKCYNFFLHFCKPNSKNQPTLRLHSCKIHAPKVLQKCSFLPVFF